MQIAFIPPGLIFGTLTVLGVGTPFQLKNGHRHSTSTCRCECGRVADFQNNNLKTGNTKNCGCLKASRIGNASRTHGATCGGKVSSEYSTWAMMIQRTCTATCKDYPLYGGRGISVCERWHNSFEAFLEDMGPKPSTRHSIDRINNNGNYEPGNCRWVTSVEQANNTRRNRRFMFYGKTMSLAQWCRISAVSPTLARTRLNRGWSDRCAIWEQPKRGRRHSVKGANS